MRGRKPSWIACWVSEKAPEMMACEAMIVAAVASTDQGIVRPVGRELVERVLERARVGDEQGALAEVVEREAGQRDREPGQADGEAPEMAHVGVHRLAPRHGQEHRPEHGEADRSGAVQEKVERVESDWLRPERRAHARCREAEDAQDGEPHQHDRAEDAADEARSFPLHEEQDHEDGDRDAARSAARAGARRP